MALIRRVPIDPDPFVVVRTALQKKPRKSSPSPKPQLRRAITDATDYLNRFKEGEKDIWKQATPRVLVGLYCVFHHHVYGVDPEELAEGKALLGAVSAAKRLIAADFAGNVQMAVEFVRWTWAREAAQLKRNGRSGDWRISWNYQFCAARLMTDYRVVLAREFGAVR